MVVVEITSILLLAGRLAGRLGQGFAGGFAGFCHRSGSRSGGWRRLFGGRYRCGFRRRFRRRVISLRRV